MEYGIPEVNPFKGQPELGLPEIFAFGFRSHWKASIDGITRLTFPAKSN
jgi:hypothetical protein